MMEVFGVLNEAVTAGIPEVVAHKADPTPARDARHIVPIIDGRIEWQRDLDLTVDARRRLEEIDNIFEANSGSTDLVAERQKLIAKLGRAQLRLASAGF